MSLPCTVHVSSSLISEPHELIVIHASSTIESGAPRIDCLALFMCPPPFSEPHECHCLALFMCPPQFFSEPHECHCLALFMCPPPFSEPHECHCLALFMCPPLSSLELSFMIA